MRHSFTLACLLAAASPASADPVCRAVEIHFAPGAPNLQIAVWIEDAEGHYVDTAYLTRLTGIFGLGNRPGEALLKTDFGWPYGRREMVLPVWAHRRNHHYPRIMMGGSCGNSPDTFCMDGSKCGGDCEDSTIAYHSRVSSYEPFYCSPSGASRIDALSCASKGTFAKGAYASGQAFSLYPPRADLMAYSPQVDAPEADFHNANSFSKLNDVVAISRATPRDGKLLDPPVTWYPNDLPDGNYVAWIELSQEADFNKFHSHPNKPDTVAAWDFEGHPFLGQPSVLYRVPFRVAPEGATAATSALAGYSTWDGSDGVIHDPNDATITQGVPGTGAGRLLDQNDGIDKFRMKVVVGACAPGDGGVPDGGPPACVPPDPVAGLALKSTATAIDVSFQTPTQGVAPNRLSIVYREGEAPITDETFFDNTVPATDTPMPTTPGATITTTIDHLQPSTLYTVAVRGISPCNRASHVISTNIATPAQKFATLSGCFVATAAYGTPMAGAVDDLRKVRDQRLLTSAAGRLFVASYYAFSPPLADAIAADKHLRAAARAALQPIVDLMREP
jgi:hypothetical protein